LCGWQKENGMGQNEEGGEQIASGSVRQKNSANFGPLWRKSYRASHRGGTEFTEAGLFLNKLLFSLRSLRLCGANFFNQANLLLKSKNDRFLYPTAEG
jgi:hypothetical protein